MMIWDDSDGWKDDAGVGYDDAVGQFEVVVRERDNDAVYSVMAPSSPNCFKL